MASKVGTLAYRLHRYGPPTLTSAYASSYEYRIIRGTCCVQGYMSYWLCYYRPSQCCIEFQPMVSIRTLIPITHDG